METLLGDVRQTLRDFIDLQETQLDEEDTKCRRELFVVDPQDDMETTEKKDRLLDDAYKWFLATKEYAAFTDWSGDKSSLPPCRLLWIKGHAGTGKTMLLIGIIRELSDQPAALSPNVSHFFCQGTDDKTYNNATAILRSLIWILLVQQPDLISHLRPMYKHKGASVFNDGNALVAMSRVFKSMLKDPRLLPVYFIVDALDKCDQGLEDLVQLISISLTLSDKVKWLVSSRPVVELKSPATVELDAQNLERPVNAYIDHKLSNLIGRKGYTDIVLAKILEETRHRAKNTFLWVALVFKSLDSVEGWYAAKIIMDIPPGLSELYNHMMTQIENGKMSDPQYCKNVLVATSLAYRPVSLSELAVLADLPPEVDPQSIVEKCGSFLTAKERTVYLIHQSAKEYLELNNMSRLQEEGAVKGHADISRYSIDAMSKLRRNIYALPYPGSKPADIRVLSPDPLEGLRYSCVYWATHVCQVWVQLGLQRSSTQLHNHVYQFLQEHLLHWVEALGWLGKTAEGVIAILSLEAQMLADESPDLQAFVHDTKRFFLHFRSVIEQVPLQIYCSALVFAPEKSIVRKQFEEYIPLWITRKPRVRADWSALLQTLEGHSEFVYAMAVTPNGKQVASGSGDMTVRLWDATTGAVLKILEGHLNSVSSVAFSPDNKQVVSGSLDKTVRLWDSVTGTALQKLKGHSDSVRSVAFSPNSKQVVSGSLDKTVRLWDATTGVVLQALKGHLDLVSSVAFSPNSKQVVSGSADKTVRLWDAATGMVLQTLECHLDSISSVAFSPNSKQVVSGSADKTIRLWDAMTGAVLQILKGHLDCVLVVAFSLDGKQVVSGSTVKTVRLWDATTGAILQTFKGYSDYVYSVAFSPDSKQVVSGSADKTVRLWDTTIGAALQTLEGHSDYVYSVAFTPDGQKVASGSADKTVWLWDTMTGAALQTLEGYLDLVWSVGFSPDGKQVVSGSADKTVRLWDAATGAALQTLEGHSDSVYSVAFSFDCKQVVSGSRDKTIQLWDAATGAALQILEGHLKSVSSIAFSPNNKQVVSGSLDKTVWLWDSITGTALQKLEGHSDSVRSVAFSPDGKQVISGSLDKTVRLWDVATGAVIQTLEGYSSYVSSVAFSRDGRLEPALFIANDWIVEEGKNTLWLSPDYRATCEAVWNRVIVLGHSSGRISILGFKERSRLI